MDHRCVAEVRSEVQAQQSESQVRSVDHGSANEARRAQLFLVPLAAVQLRPWTPPCATLRAHVGGLHFPPLRLPVLLLGVSLVWHLRGHPHRMIGRASNDQGVKFSSHPQPYREMLEGT